MAQQSTRIVIIIMATIQENPQKDSWWINELGSLGVSVKVRNKLAILLKT
jgi:hypothetical protein